MDGKWRRAVAEERRGVEGRLHAACSETPRRSLLAARYYSSFHLTGKETISAARASTCPFFPLLLQFVVAATPRLARSGMRVRRVPYGTDRRFSYRFLQRASETRQCSNVRNYERREASGAVSKSHDRPPIFRACEKAGGNQSRFRVSPRSTSVWIRRFFSRDRSREVAMLSRKSGA